MRERMRQRIKKPRDRTRRRNAVEEVESPFDEREEVEIGGDLQEKETASEK
jgi:hypothetical protein